MEPTGNQKERTGTLMENGRRVFKTAATMTSMRLCRLPKAHLALTGGDVDSGPLDTETAECHRKRKT